MVGVSQDTWKPGSSMLRALMRFGFEGPVYPVSSRGGALMGLEVYPSVQSLPEAVDVAFLFVPTQSLVEVVRQCKQKGVRGIVAFTGGFSETGTHEGRALEEELKREFDGSFRMIGPNCLGVYSPGWWSHPASRREATQDAAETWPSSPRAGGCPRTSRAPPRTSASIAARW